MVLSPFLFPFGFFFFLKNCMILMYKNLGIHCFSFIVVSGERSNNSSSRHFGGGMKRNLDDNIIEVS